MGAKTPRLDTLGAVPGHVQSALLESDARFAAIHAAAPFAISLTQMPDGRLVSVNDAFLELFELTRDEALGKTSVDLRLADPGARQRVIDELERRGRVRNFEVTRTRRSGASVTLLLNFDWVQIGGRDHVLTTVQDVTERKREQDTLRQREREASAVLDALAEGVVVLDECGAPCRFNEAAGRIIGSPAGAAHDPGAFDRVQLLDGDDEPVTPDRRPASVALRTGQPVREVELQLPLPDGTRRWVTVNATPIHGDDGRVSGAVASFVDITSLKRTEAALREADRRKDSFLAALSHELRNPLLPIRTGVDVLKRCQLPGEQAKRALEIVDRQVGQLGRLVDDLLDVARLAHGKVDLACGCLRLDELVAHAVEDARLAFDAAGLSLTVELGAQPLWVSADRARLSQALGNLLCNAAKFTGSGGRVDVELAERGGRAVVTVRDTGTGITTAELETLFQPFSQGDQPIDRSQGGLGLGLAVAKGLVELHGGELRAASAGPGQGATFSLSLPLVPAPDAAREAAPVAQGARLRVLVIDDNEDSAESLELALELGGHEVRLAHTGPEGVDAALAFLPQVVLCDIGLPGMDGYEVARTLRGDQRLEGTSLIALSGYAQPEDVARAKQAGFDRHLAKPLGLDELEQVLVDVRRPPS